MQYMILVGAPRSGTTLLGRLLAANKEVAYLEEPNVVWRYINWRKLGHEEFPPEAATAQVTDYIRSRFQRKADFPRKAIVVEKTPANALRPSFVRKVFPEAKIVLIFRDFDAVFYSAIKKWVSEDDSNAKYLGDEKRFRQFRIQLLKFLEIPFSDYSAYFSVVIREIMFGLFGVVRNMWGPQYSGFREDLKAGIYCVVAKQWLVCTKKMLSFLDIDSNVIAISYEELLSGSGVEKVEQFLGLNIDRALLREKPTAAGVSALENIELDGKIRDEVLSVMQDLRRRGIL